MFRHDPNSVFFVPPQHNRQFTFTNVSQERRRFTFCQRHLVFAAIHCHLQFAVHEHYDAQVQHDDSRAFAKQQ